MDRRFAIILTIILIVGVGLLFLKGDSKTATNANPSNHVFGTSDIGVTLTEYGDLECSACAQYHPLLKQLKSDFQGKVAFGFRHFPLESSHKNARLASRWAEAAGLQGKFFEMHDLMYENQETWARSGDPTRYFSAYADQLTLDSARLKTDAASSAVNDTINADKNAGDVFKISGTPTFILNDKKIQNPRDLESFRKILNDEIVKKGGTAITNFAASETTSPTTTQSSE